MKWASWRERRPLHGCPCASGHHAGFDPAGVDVLTAQLDGMTRLEDPPFLDRASALGRVLFSQDEDLLAEATRRQRNGESFGGVIYAHQLRITIGRAIDNLEILAQAGTVEEFANVWSICRYRRHPDGEGRSRLCERVK